MNVERSRNFNQTNGGRTRGKSVEKSNGTSKERVAG